MKSVLITGILGFIGRNLRQALSRRPDIEILGFDVQNDPADLDKHLEKADVVFHLAGVNRPEQEAEFEEGNTELTRRICDFLEKSGKNPLLVFSSSTQAEFDNPYGRSKRKAEGVLAGFAERTAAPVRIYRLPRVFGKWCRPNYNSVVATFCHNIARDLPITITDPGREIDLVHVDDVVAPFLKDMDNPPRPGVSWGDAAPIFRIALGDLSERLHSYRLSRKTLLVPDSSDPLTRRLFSTFQSYLPVEALAYDLDMKKDGRGCLAELLKAPGFGQLFVSRTKPGVTRGNHYHDLKVEKFCVLEGDAVIRFRPVQGEHVIEYSISGKDFRVVDIPPGYTHTIENVGKGELVTLFWANEPYDSNRPDTYPLIVCEGRQ